MKNPFILFDKMRGMSIAELLAMYREKSEKYAVGLKKQYDNYSAPDAEKASLLAELDQIDTDLKIIAVRVCELMTANKL